MSRSAPDDAARRARARHDDEETRYRAVAELEVRDPADRAVLLERLADPSWRVRAAAVERIGADPGAAALAELVEVLAAGPGVGAREAAAAALARIGAPVVPALVERLTTGDPDLRQAAAGVLGAIGDGRGVAPLTARLVDPDPNVRGAAVDALGRIGGADALAALRAAVDSDDATLRLGAVEALAGLGASLPVERIERLLGERTLRRALYRMLGASEDSAALAVVVRGTWDPSRAVREAALGALGLQRARRDAAELETASAALADAARRDPGLADGWVAALGSEEPLVAAGALVALGAAGEARHAGAVVRLAEDERQRAHVEDALERLPPGPELRAALADALPGLGRLARLTALSALARLGSPAALESVVREASDRGSYVQAEAIAALGRLRALRSVPPLAGLVGDEDPSTARLAASALVRIGQAGSAERDAVLAAVRGRCEASPSPAAYRVLGALGAPRDVELVHAGLSAPGAGERAAAAGALGVLARRGLVDYDRSAPALTATLVDTAAPVRAAAARALGELARGRPPRAFAADPAGARACDALVRALGEAEEAVRAAAAEALAACGRVEDAAAIAAVAVDPAAPPAVVVAGLHALAALGPVPPAALERALRHGDPEVVKEAVLVAGRLPGADGARALRDAAASPRWDVRRAAARAMAARGDASLRADAERLAERDPDPLVARAFADAARALRP
jgi:HEAT repeat protein